jgi:hypothetical protein
VYDKVARLMQWRSDLLMSGRYEDLAREYLFPLALYLNEQQLIVQSAEDLMLIMAKLQAARRQQGIATVKSDLIAMDLPRHGRFRVWVRHYEMNAVGAVVTLSDAIHYCCETPRGLQSEMAEFGQCRVPEIWDADTRRKALIG